MKNINRYLNTIKAANNFLKDLGSILDDVSLGNSPSFPSYKEKTQINIEDGGKENLEQADLEIENKSKDEAKACNNLEGERNHKNISIDFRNQNIAQAFIYSEIFGEPKCKRKSRW